MRTKRAPRVARWVLEHLVPAQSWSESLSGDLAEQWSRRSAGWYWRQVAGALAAGWAQEIYRLRFAIVFALFYVFPEPLLWIHLTRVGLYDRFFVWSVMLPWPWPFVVQLCVNLTLEFLLIWSGYAVYLVLAGVVSRPVRVGRAMRGLLTGVWVYIAVQILFAVMGLFFPFAAIDVKTTSNAAVLLAPRAIFLDIPVLVALVGAIRAAIPVEGRGGHCAVASQAMGE